MLLISVCLFLVFFAWLRNRVQALLTHAVFRQGRMASLPAVCATVRGSIPRSNT
jgi:hypothetical protein